MNANPDFKWYKLPAPPLRTLNTRPTNKKLDLLSDGEQESMKSDYFISNLTKLDEEAIQPGKLADESQIGGLSSLFTPQKVNLKDFHSVNDLESEDEDDNNPEVPKPPKKRYIELPISTQLKNECKVDLFGEKKNETESNNNKHLLVNFTFLSFLLMKLTIT